jgi:predicted nucleic acid-binding protein
MPGFVLDTSCMVAAVCAWHEHHTHAAAELNRRFGRRERMIIAAPALIEAYAVLTRLPPSHRLSAADALALLETNFMRAGRTVALDATSYCSLLRQAAADGIAGGGAYDMVIVRCAIRAKASTLLTFNARHFLPFATTRMDIVVPGPPSAVPQRTGNRKLH